VERDFIVAEARQGPGRGAGFVELDAPRLAGGESDLGEAR